MAELSFREAHQIARRLHLIQVLLNYRTMQGSGYMFALWPWLRKQDRRAEQVTAASKYINSHPVFASFAVGAIRRRLEEESRPLDSSTDPGLLPQTEVSRTRSGGEEFSQWRESLAGPLGVTGDALIWDRWKPLVFAGGALILLVVPTVTAWAIVAIASLILYNLPLYALRVWGVRQGYHLGTDVLEVLRDPRFAQARRGLTLAGIWLAGALTATGLLVSAQHSAPRGAQFAAAFLIMLLGLRFRLSASTAVLFAVIAALIVPGFP